MFSLIMYIDWLVAFHLIHGRFVWVLKVLDDSERLIVDT